MNIINAIINLINTTSRCVMNNTDGSNRANNMGEGLEKYIKDIFANTIYSSSMIEKQFNIRHFHTLVLRTILQMQC